MDARYLHFDPCPFLENPLHQTYFSSFKFLVKDPVSTSKIIPLSDGDKIVVEVTTPVNWTQTSPTVLCVHGFGGSHQSSYLCRLTNRLDPLGIRTVRLNMRGFGSGRGFAKQVYHCGSSEDVFEVIKVLKEESPLSPIILVGFSSGGNIVLKMAGELGEAGSFFIDRVIAVSPPVDLFYSMSKMSQASEGIYERYFYRKFRKHILELYEMFPDIPRVNLPEKLSVADFNTLYIVPRSGFVGLEDYYAKCSSVHLVGDISPPCKILFSEDDPIVPSHSLDGYRLPSHIEIHKTKQGGHMGYLGNPLRKRGFFWLDSVLADWILES